MNDSQLFVDERTGRLDFDQLRAEAIPIAKLMGFFLVFGLGFFLWGLFMSRSMGALGFLFLVAGQFWLVLGGAIVLMYTISRAITLARVATPAAGADSAGRSDTSDRP